MIFLVISTDQFFFIFEQGTRSICSGSLGTEENKEEVKTEKSNGTLNPGSRSPAQEEEEEEEEAIGIYS